MIASSETEFYAIILNYFPAKYFQRSQKQFNKTV